MSSFCTFLSPALPSELLTYVLNYHTYPTTLIICSSRADFLSSLIENVSHEIAPTLNPSEQHEDGEALPDRPAEQGLGKHRLLSAPLYQVATSRHIRTVYIPTVAHLRAYLSVFCPDESKVSAPPAGFNAATKRPHLLLYGLLHLHRDTSEWSAQGLSNSASVLVELAHRLSWQAVVIEPRTNDEHGTYLQEMLREPVPILSGSARRDLEQGGWSGRMVEVGRVLKRWFRFQRAEWEHNVAGSRDEEIGEPST